MNELLDWLNIKAGLSIAVVMLIASAGLWGEHELELTKDRKFEELLNRFVTMVDTVCISGASASINVTSFKTEKSRGDFILESTFEGSPYQIILTSTHASFLQDVIKHSGKFISSTKIIDSDHFIEPGTLICGKQLTEITFLKIPSGTDLTVTKIMLESGNNIEPVVIIYCS